MDLKQSTSVTLILGPFVDKDDGVTEETGLTPTVEISKNGGAFAARNSAGAIAHDSNGWYTVPIDGTDTGTLGILTVKVDDAATHLPVWKEYRVIDANTYDSRYSTENLDVNVKEISDDTTAADNLELDYDGTGYAKANSTIGTCTTNTDMVGTDSAALATVCTEARLAELDAANLPSDIDAVLADTNELQTDNIPGLIAIVDANVDAILADTGTDGVVITTATQQAIADEVLQRDVSNVEAGGADEHTLCGIILATMESSRSGTIWTIKRTDGSTTFKTKTIATDASAEPVTSVS